MTDWRLQGQERFLKSVAVTWKQYRPYREGWDHDHCEFCSAKFSLCETHLHEGYVTLDGYHWICKTCFCDFQETFEWLVMPDFPIINTAQGQ
jgi:hypothetical protein